jgi:two-component system, NtrC family, sensor kinase
MLSKWPIRNKLLVCIGLLLVIVVTLATSGFHGAYAYRGLVKGLRGRASELPLAAQLSRDVAEARMILSEAQGWLDIDSLEPVAAAEQLERLQIQFGRKLSSVRHHLRRYRLELAGNDESDDTINDSRDEWHTVRRMETTLQATIDSTRRDFWLADPEQTEAVAEELLHFQELCAEAPSFLHHRLQTMVSEVRTQYRTLIAVNLITTACAALMLGLLLRLMYTWILRPLRLLVKGSRCVAAGDFNYRICLKSRDEMAELGEALNAMTARFRSIRDDLDRQVRERTKQVVRSEQLASVGFLAAGVAHEINNPLASIALCAESLEGRVDEMLAAGEDAPPEQRKVVHQYLRMIQDEAFRCKGITERLLDFSRLGDVKPQTTNLAELVQGVIDMLSHVGQYHGKHVVFEPGSPVLAPVNPQEMKQVILNLIANGLDASEDNGTVRVKLGADGDRAVLSITDYGCGMTEEVRKHLFEPFFTRRRTGQGIGLGLSITYRIVADHGGQIDVYSAGPGQGSQFRVSLPLANSVKENSHRYKAA